MQSTGTLVSTSKTQALGAQPDGRDTFGLSLETIWRAQRRLAGVVRATPCRRAEDISASTGVDVWLKHEHLQRTRSFKERGAAHALLALDSAERRCGVIAASAGNHALGLALHGARLDTPVTLVMPVNAPRAKVDRCRAWGANVLLHGVAFAEADARARELSAESGQRYVHPFDDVAVMAGQGTAVLELLKQVPDVAAVVLPVGGGGLLGAAATVITELRPDVRLLAVEPAPAPSLTAACAAGDVTDVAVKPTLADGLAVARVGRLPFAMSRNRVAAVATVSEREIARAMAGLFETERIVAEGAGAVALAAVLAGRFPELQGERVAVLIGGANVDAETFARALRLGSSHRTSRNGVAAIAG